MANALFPPLGGAFRAWCPAVCSLCCSICSVLVFFLLSGPTSHEILKENFSLLPPPISMPSCMASQPVFAALSSHQHFWKINFSKSYSRNLVHQPPCKNPELGEVDSCVLAPGPSCGSCHWEEPVIFPAVPYMKLWSPYGKRKMQRVCLPASSRAAGDGLAWILGSSSSPLCVFCSRESLLLDSTWCCLYRDQEELA